MKSFLQGKKTLTLPALRPPAGLVPPSRISCDTTRSTGDAAQHQHAPAAGNATVEVVKEGDKVVRLVITCVCGERVEVECLYPAGR
jgi:hypothetical protein